MNTESYLSAFAGIGLFFVGINLLKSMLKQGCGNALQALIKKVSGNSCKSAAFGIFTGMVTQSGRVTSYIISSFMSVEIITFEKALPIILWSNVGCAIIVFTAVLPMKLVILILLGLCGVGFTFEIPARFKNFYGAVFSVALFLLGLDMIKTSSVSLMLSPSFRTVVEVIGSSGFMAFVLGLVLTTIAQSHIGIILIILSMSQAGLFSANQILLTIYGTHLGSSTVTYLFAMDMRGSERQSVMAQVLFNIVGICIFMVLYIIETYANIPLFMSAVNSISGDVAKQGAIITVVFNLATAAITSIVQAPYAHYIKRLCPPDRKQHMSKAKYLSDNVLDDINTALILVEKEQNRLLSRLPIYLQDLRVKQSPPISTYHEAFVTLKVRIQTFMSTLLNNNVSTRASDSFLSMQNRLALLEAIEEDVYAFHQEFTSERNSADTSRQLSAYLLEAMDTMLITTLEAASDVDELPFLNAMTENKGNLMDEVRNKYISAEENMTTQEKVYILHITNIFERILWALSRLGKLLAKGQVNGNAS